MFVSGSECASSIMHMPTVISLSEFSDHPVSRQTIRLRVFSVDGFIKSPGTQNGFTCAREGFDSPTACSLQSVYKNLNNPWDKNRYLPLSVDPEKDGALQYHAPGTAVPFQSAFGRGFSVNHFFTRSLLLRAS